MVDAPSEAGDFDKDLDPYFLAIGKVSAAWNRLQDSMALLFVELHHPLPSSIPLGVWYTVKSDRGQREMLKAAAAAWFQDDDHKSLTKALNDINWLMNRIEVLEDQRNNALHAPLGISIDREERVFTMVPWTMLGNPRAMKLKGKKLLKEFEWYAEMCQTLNRFCNAVQFVIAFHHVGEESRPWPDRPRLPHLGQSPTAD